MKGSVFNTLLDKIQKSILKQPSFTCPRKHSAVAFTLCH